MKTIKYIKSNISIIGMLAGIVIISSLFFMPLEEHW
jgi:hypothetical protein